MPDIEFPTSAGTAPGYLAVPAGERGPATIVLQEWWGLDEHIRSVCDRFAAEGFFALAPDLYRGDSTTQPSEAEQKMMALSSSWPPWWVLRVPVSGRSASAWVAGFPCGRQPPARRSLRSSPTTT